MSEPIPFELRLKLSKKLPPGVPVVKAGRYTLRPIPGTGSDEEAVLSFDLQVADGASNPLFEAQSVCRLLSLFVDARIQTHSARVNYIDVPSLSLKKSYPQFLGKIDPSTIEKNLECVLTKDKGLARQFLRASHAYSFALDFIAADVTFAFFLLVVSIECLSSQDAVIPHSNLPIDPNKCERFCHFIQEYLPSSSRNADESDAGLLTELLKTIYYAHRSGFAHGGKEVSTATLMADRVGSAYFKHELDGKEVKTPGVGWFASVVRRTLLGYLHSTRKQDATPNPFLLSELALEKASLRMKIKRDIKKGAAVTFDDVEYR